MLLTNTIGQAYSGKLCIHTSWNDAEVNTGVYSMTFQFLFSLETLNLLNTWPHLIILTPLIFLNSKTLRKILCPILLIYLNLPFKVDKQHESFREERFTWCSWEELNRSSTTQSWMVIEFLLGREQPYASGWKGLTEIRFVKTMS